jgi:hypothetical protein
VPGLHTLKKTAVDQQVQIVAGDIAMAAAGNAVGGAVVEELGVGWGIHDRKGF